LPTPSYVLTSSPGRFHIFWRVNEFEATQVERLQRQLARELGTDGAAIPVSQLTRLIGFHNHKHQPPSLVTIVYGDVDRVFTLDDFPRFPRRRPSNPYR
jgi:RepB DNA-primase N-terminal domain